MPQIEPIATIRTCYTDKFGVPRQSGLAPDAWGIIEFTPAYRREEAVRGLEKFSHLWLIAQFHLVKEDHAGLTVRPPRLGGNERLGVFATRSPFRPNRLMLSVVKLDRVELEEPGGPRLYVSGVDLVDGTPIFDIKPYIPYADALPHAEGGFANGQPATVAVRWQCPPPPGTAVQRVIEQSLSLQPQPAYLEDAERTYATEISGNHVKWRLHEGGVVIDHCMPLDKR